jgi:hypothetical protein
MWHEALPNIDKVVCLVGPLVLWCCNCLMLWATEQIPCVLQLPLPLPHAYTWIPLTICLSQANIYYGSNYKQSITQIANIHICLRLCLPSVSCRSHPTWRCKWTFSTTRTHTQTHMHTPSSASLIRGLQVDHHWHTRTHTHTHTNTHAYTSSACLIRGFAGGPSPTRTHTHTHAYTFLCIFDPWVRRWTITDTHTHTNTNTHTHAHAHTQTHTHTLCSACLIRGFAGGPSPTHTHNTYAHTCIHLPLYLWSVSSQKGHKFRHFLSQPPLD